MKNEKIVSIDSVKVWNAVEVSYSGNLATRELIEMFKPVAEEKGLEHAGYAFQVYFIKSGIWPTKTLKSGKVQPIGWQKSLVIGKEILNREPNNARGIDIVKITTVYNNMLSMIAADKAAIKKAKDGEGEGEGEGEGKGKGKGEPGESEGTSSLRKLMGLPPRR